MRTLQEEFENLMAVAFPHFKRGTPPWVDTEQAFFAGCLTVHQWYAHEGPKPEWARMRHMLEVHRQLERRRYPQDRPTTNQGETQWELETDARPRSSNVAVRPYDASTTAATIASTSTVTMGPNKHGFPYHQRAKPILTTIWNGYSIITKEVEEFIAAIEALVVTWQPEDPQAGATHRGARPPSTRRCASRWPTTGRAVQRLGKQPKRGRPPKL